ncbi:MAG TPA: hypothetical protein PLD45_05170 [Spirochaetales bacterium]|nr:hypothetical protein [Spirochaetales bacterium]
MRASTPKRRSFAGHGSSPAGARASLVAMRWGNDARANAYHTPADTPEAVDPAVVEALLNLGLRFAEDIDAKIL